MMESRCGIVCSECDFFQDKTCAGCIAIDKPFWGEFCPVKSCCEGRRYEHCGQCEDFPCKLLNQFAYDKEQGDEGKRIEACRMWAQVEAGEVRGQESDTGRKSIFDPKKFIDAVAAQDANALKAFFAPEAIICWHDSNEQFTVAEYIQANCEYPGSWGGEVKRVEIVGNGMAVVSKIFSDELTVLVTAFITLADGKITKLDEYYAGCSEAPNWRKEMNIGRPIA